MKFESCSKRDGLQESVGDTWIQPQGGCLYIVEETKRCQGKKETCTLWWAVLIVPLSHKLFPGYFQILRGSKDICALVVMFHEFRILDLERSIIYHHVY